MRLDRLLGDVEVVELRSAPMNGPQGHALAIDITAVTHDSRAVQPGALFCCVPGTRSDGHDFAPQAVAAGAVALLCERPLDVAVPQVRVANSRAAMAVVAATFWGHPSLALEVVGITGTTGKTTTTHLLRAVLESAGRPCGLVGTLTGLRTTPEATELQATLAAFRDEGRVAVAMEVSSVGLALHRLDATWFVVTVFTNLGRDHLDVHGTEEAYFRAKASLFEPDRTAVAVINADDRYGRLLLSASRVQTVPYSLADATDIDVGVDRCRFVWRGQAVDLGLGGRYNISNALAAATAAEELGVEPADIAKGLSSAPPVPGRFESVDAGQPFGVIVDYAHTPESLEQLLHAARFATTGRVLVVFGTGGERDRTKRPLMGHVASRLADLVVLTSDNPRSEDPVAIIDEVRTGVVRPQVLVVEPDRRSAIALALDAAAPDDLVVIAGKGHETGQEVGGRMLAFDDRVVARQLLEERWR